MPAVVTNRISEQKGFTAVELLVIVGIVAFLAAAVIPNLKTWRLQQDLAASARELATQLQKIRSHALAGRQINGLVAQYYAMRLTTSSPSAYTVEGIAYDSGGGSDQIFNGSSSPVLQNMAFPGGVQVQSLVYERPAGTPQSPNPTCVIVAFELPYANTYIDTDTNDGLDDDGACDFFTLYQSSAWRTKWSNARLVITLAKPGTSLTKTVTVNGVTGQIGN